MTEEARCEACRLTTSPRSADASRPCSPGPPAMNRPSDDFSRTVRHGSVRPRSRPSGAWAASAPSTGASRSETPIRAFAARRANSRRGLPVRSSPPPRRHRPVGCRSGGRRGGRAGRPPGLRRLSDIARCHPDPLCREAAVAALGTIGDVAGKAALSRRSTPAPAPAVRRRSVAGAAFSGTDVEVAWRARPSDRDWQVRRGGREVLGISCALKRSTQQPWRTPEMVSSTRASVEVCC